MVMLNAIRHDCGQARFKADYEKWLVAYFTFVGLSDSTNTL